MNSVRKLLHACLPTRNDRFLWLVVSVVTLAIVAVNALSQLTDAERRGDVLPAYMPWITEATSAVFIIPLFPVIAWFVRHLPVSSSGIKKTILCHFLLSISFSAVHVAGMVGLRKLVFSVVYGHGYSFFDVIWRDALYEYRKDIVTYLLFISLLYLMQALTRRDAALEKATREPAEERVSFKCGSRQIWLKPSDISHAKAAGNYVELYAGDSVHLVRLSMAALERQLHNVGLPIVRVHRSHLVNKEKVLAVTPKADGDSELSLADGATIPASRRYRDNLRHHGLLR